MSDIEKVLNVLALSEKYDLDCSLKPADCTRLMNFIDALQTRIDDLETQRWIPVSERLPEGRTVLVFKKDGSISIDTTYIDGGNYFWWESGQSKVTHWMPLPEPPEAQDADKSAECTHEGEVKDELLAK
jgi:hypothetical protein